MKWYDYLFCIVAADAISAGLFSLNIFLLALGILGYIIYEKASIAEREN